MVGRSLRALVLLVAFAGVGFGSVSSAAAAELLMFEEAGCSWCLKWDREVGPAYPRSDEGQIAPLRKVHISMAARLGIDLASPVTMTPTFVLVDERVEKGRITGYPGEDFFWGLLAPMVGRLKASPPPEPARDAGLSGPGGVVLTATPARR